MEKTQCFSTVLQTSDNMVVGYNNAVQSLEMCPHGQHNGFTD